MAKKTLSLLEKATAVMAGRKSYRRVYGAEEIELALAWVRGEVVLRQIAETLGASKGSGSAAAYNFLALALRAAIQADAVR